MPSSKARKLARAAAKTQNEACAQVDPPTTTLDIASSKSSSGITNSVDRFATGRARARWLAAAADVLRRELHLDLQQKVSEVLDSSISELDLGKSTGLSLVEKAEMCLNKLGVNVDNAAPSCIKNHTEEAQTEGLVRAYCPVEQHYRKRWRTGLEFSSRGGLRRY